MRAAAISIARALIAGSVCAALVGCEGYQSAYVAPRDGRARLVWSGDSPVFLGPAGIPPECLAAIDPSQLEIAPYSRPAHYYVVGGPPVVFVAAPVRAVHPVPLAPHFHGPGLGVFTGKGGGGGYRNAEAILAVAVLLALPFVTLGLAVGNPEPSDETASAMDRVNAFNDLARQPGTPCSMVMQGPSEALPQ